MGLSKVLSEPGGRHVCHGNVCPTHPVSTQHTALPQMLDDGGLKDSKTPPPCNMTSVQSLEEPDNAHPCTGAEGNPGLRELTGGRASWRR